MGASSRPFDVKRGVKQGDPISGLLFLAVIEVCFRKLVQKWSALNGRRKGQYIGLVIDDPCQPLTNLRFADDALLISQSLSDARKMVDNLVDIAATYGLKFNLDKTKILATSRCPAGHVNLASGGCMEILGPDGSERYLGRRLCYNDHHQMEVRNRMGAAWSAFAKFGSVFKSKSYPFMVKAQLFEEVVTPSATYGSSAWTTFAEMEQILETTRRRMLRTMLGRGRHPQEDWVHYIKRTTHEA